jgi:hypothetical protein
MNCRLKGVIWSSHRLWSAYRQPWLWGYNGCVTVCCKKAQWILKSYSECFGKNISSIWACNFNLGYIGLPAFWRINRNRLSFNFYKAWVATVAWNKVSCVLVQTIEVLDFKLNLLEIWMNIKIVKFWLFWNFFFSSIFWVFVFEFYEWQGTVDF